MGSTRLPGKVLRPIAGRPLLAHVLGRLADLRHDAQIVVATSTNPVDDVIYSFCTELGMSCFRGSETDVLARYWECALEYRFEQIVRLTADNPFTDVHELDRLIDIHLQAGNDYTHSFGDMPVGVGAEIFTFAGLQRSHLEGHASNHREHVNEYIQENPSKFRIGQLTVPAVKRQPSLRLTVDTMDDYQRACELAERAPDRWLSTEDAIRLCSRSV